MRSAHPHEQRFGVAWYASESDGIGGRLKDTNEDFQVTEIEGIDPEPLSADTAAYPFLVVRARLSGWDTFDFVDRLAGALGVDRRTIDWAGTKDKAAVSTQLFTIRGAVASDLPEVPNGDIEPVGRLGRGLTFGDLLGNVFRIRVRDAEAPARYDRISAELTRFGDGALTVPNFFGHQRFGSRRQITHAVGLAILARDWEGAVMTYLGSASPREPPDTRAAREYIEETRDWTGGLDRMPRGLTHERRMLEALQRGDACARPYRAALERLPEDLRRLFVHAAQSYIFNRILSERGSRGIPFTAAVPGDEVCFASQHDVLGAVPDPSRRQRVTAERVTTVNRHIASGRAFVTAPLVGIESERPGGRPGDIVESILEDLGVTPADFDLPDPYHSTGTSRPIVTRPDISIESDPLTFEFGLPSGAYATVVMREYLKTDPDAMA